MVMHSDAVVTTSLETVFGAAILGTTTASALAAAAALVQSAGTTVLGWMEAANAPGAPRRGVPGSDHGAQGGAPRRNGGTGDGRDGCSVVGEDGHDGGAGKRGGAGGAGAAPRSLDPRGGAAGWAGQFLPAASGLSVGRWSADRGRPGAHRPLVAGLDRVDVLLALGRRVGTPVVHALLASAYELLGAILRDRGLVAEVQVAAAPGGAAPDPAVWRVTLVAEGLLGCAPEAGDAIVAGRDRLSAQAFALAAILAEGVGAGAAGGALMPLLSAAGEAPRVAMQVRAALLGGRRIDAVR